MNTDDIITIRLDPPTREALDKLIAQYASQQLDVTISAVVRQAINRLAESERSS